MKFAFTAYGCEFVRVINVAGGGLMNGNAYATIEINYTNADLDEVKSVYYCEYGRNPSRNKIGDDIEWGEDDDFNVLNDGEVVDCNGDKIEDEEEEEEEEDTEDIYSSNDEEEDSN
jgi:hypothetical protein